MGMKKAACMEPPRRGDMLRDVDAESEPLAILRPPGMNAGVMVALKSGRREHSVRDDEGDEMIDDDT